MIDESMSKKGLGMDVARESDRGLHIWEEIRAGDRRGVHGTLLRWFACDTLVLSVDSHGEPFRLLKSLSLLYLFHRVSGNIVLKVRISHSCI